MFPVVHRKHLVVELLCTAHDMRVDKAFGGGHKEPLFAGDALVLHAEDKHLGILVPGGPVGLVKKGEVESKARAALHGDYDGVKRLVGGKNHPVSVGRMPEKGGDLFRLGRDGDADVRGVRGKIVVLFRTGNGGIAAYAEVEKGRRGLRHPGFQRLFDQRKVRRDEQDGPAAHSLMNPKRRQSLAGSAGGQKLAPVPTAKACQHLLDDFALVRQGRELLSADGGVPGPGKAEQPREECAVKGAQAVAQNGELVLLLLRLLRKCIAVCKDAPPVGMLRFCPEGSQLIIGGSRLRTAEFDLVGDRRAALLKNQAVNTAILFLQLILLPVCFGDLGSHIKLPDLIEVAKIGEISIGELLKGIPLLLERFDCLNGLFQLVPAGIELPVNFVKRHRLPSVLYGDAVPGFAIIGRGNGAFAPRAPFPPADTGPRPYRSIIPYLSGADNAHSGSDFSPKTASDMPCVKYQAGAAQCPDQGDGYSAALFHRLLSLRPLGRGLPFAGKLQKLQSVPG